MNSKKTSRKKSDRRTKQIAIKPAAEPEKRVGVSPENNPAAADPSPLLKVTNQGTEGTFQLGVQVPHAAHEVLKNSAKIPQFAQKKPEYGHTASPNASVGTKIWNTLEWIATSALIFTVLFLAMNFGAYSSLFISKLNQLRGEVQTNPMVQNLTHSAGVTQQPLPITSSADQSKKQVPYLNLEIAPPDDRVIIPRIDKNVPVVKVSSQNLIKRDWGALETDIQEALRYGVVHYPGTAEPGENGNVVITGHSSYFAWDPGRFKDVFALLHEVVVGDTIIVYHNQKKYFYQVYDKQVVTPDKIDILTQKGENRLTLLTCTPVGTNLKRLVIFAKPTKN